MEKINTTNVTTSMKNANTTISMKNANTTKSMKNTNTIKSMKNTNTPKPMKNTNTPKPMKNIKATEPTGTSNVTESIRKVNATEMEELEKLIRADPMAIVPMMANQSLSDIVLVISILNQALENILQKENGAIKDPENITSSLQRRLLVQKKGDLLSGFLPLLKSLTKKTKLQSQQQSTTKTKYNSSSSKEPRSNSEGMAGILAILPPLLKGL